MHHGFVDIEQRKPAYPNLHDGVSELNGMAIIYDSRYRVNMPEHIIGENIPISIYDFKIRQSYGPVISLDKCKTAKDLVNLINEYIISNLNHD